MGYSVYVEFKDLESKNKMLGFLESEYRDLNAMVGYELSPEMAGRLGDDISYKNDNHKYVVGFDYSSWIDYFERNYLNALCMWIAITSSNKQDFENRPYYVYDGCENEWFTCDNENGYKPMVRYMRSIGKGDLRKYNILLEKELLRLTDIFYIF